MHDLTRRQAAEAAAARSQRLDAIGQMTGGIAHDFNNLLTVITGNLELLQMAEKGTKKTDLIADALEAAEMGADLTSRLLVFARKSNLKTEVIVLNEAVAQSLAMLHRAVGPLTDVLAPDLWRTRVDETQLQTAVLNLVLNAQDAMLKGGRLFLEIRRYPEKGVGAFLYHQADWQRHGVGPFDGLRLCKAAGRASDHL